MMNKFSTLFVLFMLLSSFYMKAQVGREFWFVAPSVIQDHGDDPVAFRITALDQPANVTFSMPADPGFTPIALSLDAYEQDKIEFLDRDVEILENSPADQINSKGVLITSDVDITVYYEVVGSGLNPDKFTLKGNSALGREFYVSSQTSYGNMVKDNYITELPYEKVDIVATEDGTTVEIIPTAAVVGHAANVPYSVILNRGETYCIQGTSRDYSYNLSGTHIQSDKPITVTISDDSVQEQGWDHDLIGDQTIPVSVIGTEYIAMSSGAGNPSVPILPIDKVYIMATQDNTTITVDVDENTTGNYTINTGEHQVLDIIRDSALHITSTSPVYVYQLSGLINHSNELGSAILPPIKCTGSSSVSFTKTLNARFFVQILTQYKNINSFTFMENDGTINNELDNLDWFKVPNTGADNADNTWYFVNKQLNNLSTGNPYTLSNSNGLFHLSVFDENLGSASFGYFSAFNNLAIDAPTEECNGEVITLTANESLDSYSWYSAATGDAILSDNEILEVTKSGTYWVEATRMINSTESCELVASIDVEFKMPEFSLGDDVDICLNETYIVTPTLDEGIFEWNDGSSDKTYTYTATTEDEVEDIWLQIEDENGCSSTDNIIITTLPKVEIEFDVEVNASNVVCFGYKLSNITSLDTYEWRYGDSKAAVISTDSYINVENSGWYYLTATLGPCSATDSIEVTVLPLPTITLQDEILCYDEVYTSPVNTNNYSYSWRTVKSGVTSITSQIELNQTDSVYVEFKDVTSGCASSDSALITFLEKTNLPSKAVNICAYTDVEFVASILIVSDYSWTYNSIDLNNASNTFNLVNVLNSQAGSYVVSGLDVNGCSVSQEFVLTVTLGDAIDLGDDKEICDGNSVELSINTPTVSYQWFHNQNPEIVNSPTVVNTTMKYNVDQEGMYYVKSMHANGCASIDSVKVTVNGLPVIDLPDINLECQGESHEYDARAGFDSYLWQDGSTGQRYIALKPEEVSVTVTDNKGCSNSDVTTYEWKEVTIFDKDELVSCPLINYTIQTNGSLSNISWYYNSDVNSGSANINLNNTTNSYTINNVDLSDAGYYIVIADEDGCTVMDTIQFYVVDVGSINLGDDRAICNGDLIQLNANEGFHSYEWRLGSAIGDVISTSSSVIAGNGNDGAYEEWNLTVEHASGCMLSSSVVVEKMLLPTIDLTDNIEPCYSQSIPVSDLIVNVNSNSNIDPANAVSYYWNGSGNATPIENMVIENSGTYELKVSNRNEMASGDMLVCYSSDVVDVDFHDEFVIPSLFDQFICPDETVDLEAPDEVINFGELQNYQWVMLDYKGTTDSIIHTSNQPWDNLNSLGYYVLSVNYTDEACVASDTLQLYVKEVPELSILGDTEFCKGETTTLSANSVYASYLWSTGAVTETISLDVAGDYTLEVIGHNGCDASSTASVVVNELPIISLNENSLDICEESSASIEVTSVNYPDGTSVVNPSFEWSTWEITDSIHVSSAGVYSVKATDSNECYSEANATVNIFPKPVLDLSGIKTTECDHEGISLVCPLTFGVDISGYQWSKSGDSGNMPASNSDWTVYESGTYILTVVDNNLCEAIDSIKIKMLPSPSVYLGDDANVCVGEEITIPSPEIYSSYLWNTGSTNSSITVQSSISSVQYSVEVWDKNGCSATDDIMITAINLPVVSIPEPPISCSGSEVELIPQITNAPASYSVWWSTYTNSETITVGAGTYTVEITDKNNGCSGSASVSVSWYDAPSVSLGEDQYICPLIPEVFISPEEGDIFNGYLWHNNLTYYEISGEIGEINSVLVQDEYGCTGFDQVVLQYKFTEDTVYTFAMCQQDTTVSMLELDSDSANHTGEYYWLHDGSTNAFNTFSTVDSFAVDIGITEDGVNTCYYKRDTLVFDFYSPPKIEVLDTVIYGRVAVKMDMENAPYSYSVDSMNWQSDNVFTGLETNTYTLYVVDSNNCGTKETFSLSADIEIEVPNFFTPNNDGHNDYWEMSGIEKFPESVIRIYDRYGKLLAIYPASNPGWDGTYQNVPMPSTDYWYVIELVPVYKLLKGHFTLKR